MINFTKQIIVTKSYCVDVDEFVDKHLVEVRLYDSDYRIREYDFYVTTGLHDSNLKRAFSIEASKLKGIDIDNPASIKEKLQEYFKKVV